MAAPRKKKAKKDTSFSTWKFNLENTVNADPRLGPACLKIVRAYLDWMASPTATPYLSIIHLRVVTSLAEHTIIKCRRELEQEGYFVPAGKSSAGAIMYKIVNAGENRVLDHIIEAREKLLDSEAYKKQRERRKKVVGPAENAGPLSPAEIAGNNVYNSVNGYSSEEEEDLNGVSYSSIKAGNEANSPLPIPKDQAEAESMMTGICSGVDVYPGVRSRMMSMLSQGILTPKLAAGMIGKQKEGAA